MARQKNILLYCNARAPEEEEHWKSEIPNLGVGEVIKNFRKLYSAGTKRFYHAIVEATGAQVSRVTSYIETYNEGKAIQDQILYWHGNTDEDAYRSLWQDKDTDPFINAIAIRVLRYPIKSETGNPDHPIFASVKDAVDIYGLTINSQKIKIPHKFLGV